MSKGIKRHVFTLQPNETNDVPFTGGFISVSESSDTIMVGIDDDNLLLFPAGFQYRAPLNEKGEVENFQKIRISNPTGNAVSGVIFLCDGQIYDNRFFVTQPLQIGSPSNFVTTPDLVCPNGVRSTVAGANPNRKKLIVKSLSANTGAVRIGDNLSGATSGIELMPGDTLVLDTAGTVTAWNASGASQTLSVGFTS